MLCRTDAPLAPRAFGVGVCVCVRGARALRVPLRMPRAGRRVRLPGTPRAGRSEGGLEGGLTQGPLLAWRPVSLHCRGSPSARGIVGLQQWTGQLAHEPHDDGSGASLEAATLGSRDLRAQCRPAQIPWVVRVHTRRAGAMPGLVNLGNTCFIASVMQALASSPTVLEGIRHQLCELPEDGLGSTAGAMIINLADHREGQGPINPTKLVSAIKAQHKYLGHGAQEDAEEAFLILIAALFSKGQSSARSAPVQWRGSPAVEQALARQRASARGAAATAGAEVGLGCIASLELAASHRSPHHSLALPPPLEDPVFSPSAVLHAATPLGASQGGDAADERRNPDSARSNLEDRGRGLAGQGGEGGAGSEGGGATSLLTRPDSGIWLPAHLCSAGRGLAVLQQPRSRTDAMHPAMGLLSSVARCMECGSQQEMRLDPFFDVSLTVPRVPVLGASAALEDCLRLWAEPEVIEGARCDRCLHSITTARTQARRNNIASLRTLAPNSLGVHALIAEDAELEQMIAALQCHAPTPSKAGSRKTFALPVPVYSAPTLGSPHPSSSPLSPLLAWTRFMHDFFVFWS